MRSIRCNTASAFALMALGGAFLLGSCTATPDDEGPTTASDRPTSSAAVEPTPTGTPSPVEQPLDADLTFDAGGALSSGVSLQIESTRFTGTGYSPHTTRYEEPGGCYIEFAEHDYNAMGAGDREATAHAIERRGMRSAEEDPAPVRYPYDPTGTGSSRNIEFIGVHHIDEDTSASVYTTVRVLSEPGEMLLIEYGCPLASDLDGYVDSMQPEFSVTITR